MSRPHKPKDFWDDSETTQKEIERGARNRKQVLADLIRHALSNQALNAACVAQWHKDCFSGLAGASNECFLGAYRGSRHPRLKNMRVVVDAMEGAPAHAVIGELNKFFRQLQDRVSNLEAQIKIDQDKSKNELRRVAELAGWAHGEWVRIHPFANGSGRTARLIANWVLSRFRLLPVVGIRPRPEHPYGQAAVASMRGDHRRITRFIVDLFENPPRS